MPNSKTSSRKDYFFLITVPIIVGLILSIGFGVWLLFFAPKDNRLSQLPGIKQTKKFINNQFPVATKAPEKENRLAALTPTPRPIRKGMSRFKISGGIAAAPQFGSGSVDPVDPGQGNEQTLKINITSDSEVQSAKVTVLTDNGQKDVPMELASGDKTNGQWQATWTIDDTYIYRYKLNLEATNNAATQETSLLLR